MDRVPLCRKALCDVAHAQSHAVREAGPVQEPVS